MTDRQPAAERFNNITCPDTGGKLKTESRKSIQGSYITKTGNIYKSVTTARQVPTTPCRNVNTKRLFSFYSDFSSSHDSSVGTVSSLRFRAHPLPYPKNNVGFTLNYEYKIMVTESDNNARY